jgi:acetyl esterase
LFQEEGETMSLDPRIQAFLEQTGLLFKPGSMPREPMVLLAELRANDERVKPLVPEASTREPVAHVENLAIAGPAGDIPVRLYTPAGLGPFPVLVYFHGGGFHGNLDTHEIMCRSLCRGAGCLVLSVGFRLPPEHKFPAGLEDGYAAACWMAAHAAQFQGDPTRIAVGGDSGGGNFAAVIALMAHDRGGPALALQLLFCPLMDFQLTTPSWKDFDGYIINREEFLIYRDFYVSNEQEQSHPYISPLLAPDLHGLPPALIITAECDPLRDGGERYGQRLLSAGIPTTVSRYEGMVHGFIGMSMVVPQEAEAALREATLAVRAAFASGSRR